MIAPDMFQGLVGQTKVKSKLQFFADGQRSRGYIPAILLNGSKGLGKTEFAKKFASNLKKPLMEINCSTIRNEQSFFEELFMGHILGREITVLFDECHELPEKLMASFLTVFNPEGAKSKRLQWRENELEFNFEKQTYLFATTEAHELFGPFKDRLNKIDFSPYATSELIQIVKNKADYIAFGIGVLDKVGASLRGNARSAVARAVEIMLYCENKNKSNFTLSDWADLCKTLDICQYGLSAVEIELLKILRDRGACTLQMLAAATGLSRAAIQKESEVHLLREGLMKIDAKREITDKGRRFLASV